jgi:hypothetical protein
MLYVYIIVIVSVIVIVILYSLDIQSRCLLINVDIYSWEMWRSRFLKLFCFGQILIMDTFHSLAELMR